MPICDPTDQHVMHPLFGGSVKSVEKIGDSHPHGCVTKVSLDSGKSYVGKPRSIVGEVVLYEVEQALFDRMALRTAFPSVIFQSTQLSILEWLEPSSPYAIDTRAYFYCAGIRLSILFCLGATDIGHENVIVHDGQLVVVDAETLFSPDVVDLNTSKAYWPLSLHYCSPARVGLIPSNHIFSPIYNARHYQLARTEYPAIIPALDAFPKITPGYVAALTDGFMAGIDGLADISIRDLVIRTICRHSEQLSRLRVILRPTKAYIDHMNGDHVIEDLNLAERAQIGNGYVPYFDYSSLGIDFDGSLAAQLFCKLLIVANRNRTYMVRAIERACLT